MDSVLPLTSLQTPNRRRWDALFDEFLACHRSGLNVTLHLVTTPLGIFAALALAAQYSSFAAAAAVGVYLLVLLFRVPFSVWLSTGAALGVLLAAALLAPPPWFVCIGLAVAAYLLQDLAHLVSAEPTLQSTYAGSSAWLRRLAEHTFYLLPLVLATALRLQGGLLSFLVARNCVLHATLDAASTPDLAQIRDFVEREDPPLERSSHWWQQELERPVELACENLANAGPIVDMFRRFFGAGYAVESLAAMNEIYVTGPSQELTSDTVFYTPHIDGPWAVYPFASVYRCMVGITRNDRVTTHFPLNGLRYESPESHTLSLGEALAFDYNREPHYITTAPGPNLDRRRINLKLHFLVYPRALAPYGRLLGRLTTWYNTRARQLFLDTIAPDSLLARAGAATIVATTKLFELVVRRVGWNNLAYTVLWALLSASLGSMRPFLVATSFVHYLMYIGTFAERGPVAFGRFRRNVVWFKLLSYAQLAACCTWYFEWNYLALALIAGGFGLSALAYRALGPERTYFGVELGFCEPRRITAFPYNVVPHPMIVGSMIGLSGMYLLAPLREALPWLIPGHLLCYGLHLWQELRSSAARSKPAEQRDLHAAA